MIPCLENVTALRASPDHYVPKSVQRVSTVTSASRIVDVRTEEAAILRRVSAFVRLDIRDRYVRTGAKANGMGRIVRKSVNASTVQTATM